jgi:hypothetical protein
MPKTGRKAIYRAIDGERDYQDKMKVGLDGRTDGRQKSVGDYLALLDVYVRKAQDAYAGRPGDEPSLNEIRKVAAIAVQCMEGHGAPKREKLQLMSIAELENSEKDKVNPPFPKIVNSNDSAGKKGKT